MVQVKEREVGGEERKETEQIMNFCYRIAWHQTLFLSWDVYALTAKLTWYFLP